MTLYDVMMACKYYQIFHVYVGNAYDQNIEIGHGERRDILNEDKCEEGINHLMDKVERLSVAKDGSIVLVLVDLNYEKPADAFYDPAYVSRWDESKPETRPWRYSCELEDFPNF